MPTLFDLTGDALRLQQQIDAAAELLFSDDPAEVAAAQGSLERLIADESDNRRQVEAKADAWCWVIDQMRAEANARAEHAQRLKDLAAAAEQRAEALQDQLIRVLSKLAPDATSWNLPSHRISSRRVTAVDVSVDVADLPEQFVRARTSYSADKTALKEALQAGQQIDGVALVERRSWKIA